MYTCATKHKVLTEEDTESIIFTYNSKLVLFVSRHRLFERIRPDERFLTISVMIQSIRTCCLLIIKKKEDINAITKMDWPPQSPNVSPIQILRD